MAEPAGSVDSGKTGITEAGIHTGTGSGTKTQMYLILALSVCSIALAADAKLPTDADCTSTYRSMGQDAM